MGCGAIWPGNMTWPKASINSNYVLLEWLKSLKWDFFFFLMQAKFEIQQRNGSRGKDGDGMGLKLMPLLNNNIKPSLIIGRVLCR